jgi:hypothetical protein
MPVEPHPLIETVRRFVAAEVIPVAATLERADRTRGLGETAAHATAPEERLYRDAPLIPPQGPRAEARPSHPRRESPGSVIATFSATC